MATTFTTNFLLPKLDTGSSNWGSVSNGAMETLDIELYKAQHPIVKRSGEIMVSNVQGMVIKKKYSTTGG